MDHNVHDDRIAVVDTSEKSRNNLRPATLHFCTSDSWGGLEIYSCSLMQRLQSAGCRVLAVCKPHSKVEEFLVAREIPFVHLPHYSPASIASIRFVRSILQLHDIQILHVHFHKDIWPASLALRGDTCRRLYVSMYMGVGSKDDFWHRYIYRRVDGFFTSSKTLTARLPSLYVVPGQKVHFLPYGRALDRDSKSTERGSAIRSMLGLKPADTLVGTMVRIDPGKGVLDFVESYVCLEESLRNKVHYLIVGEPTRKGRLKKGESPFEPRCEKYLGEIQSFVSKHNLEKNIHFAGFQKDVTGYLGAMDIFVFPSRDELYSLVMLDAMALPLPIIAARASGNLEQIEDGVNGLLYEVASPQDLAAKLSIYLNNPQQRRQHQRAARSFVEQNHDMTKTVNRLMEFYSSNDQQ